MLRNLSVLAIALTLTGCGGGGPGDMPEIGQVTGTITVDGSPKANVIVAFQPEGGRPSQGITDNQGNYELVYSRDAKGAKIGKNLVTLSTDTSGDSYESENSSEDKSEEEDAKDPEIPAKYNTEAIDNPEMTVEVKAGSNEFSWDIKTGG